MKIFVANIPFHITDTGIRELFELFGPVSSSKILSQNGKSKGYGFLEMENDEQAERAIKELDGSAIGDRNLIVRHAENQSDMAINSHEHKRPRIYR